MEERFPHLSKAPITEALIDIQVVLPADKQIADLDSVASRVSVDYPKKRMDISVSDVRVQLGQAPTAEIKQERLGFGLASDDGRNIFQARLNGFTFSRLKPYETWEALKNEATRLWKVYRETCTPDQVTRIAVRYINHLLLPVPTQNFGDFLTAGPRLPPRLSQELVAFLTRNVILDKSSGALAIITQSFDPDQKPLAESMSVLLDIDAFYQVSLDPGLDTEIEEHLERLHLVKNRIFFESITEKMEELCR
jgi:uncharacterized protein (TIGR04255 family)